MKSKTLNRRRRITSATIAIAASAALMIAASVTPSASSASPTARGAAASVLTMESSPETTLTQNFNPFTTSSAAYLVGATSLIYEPLLQFDVAKPSVAPYPFLATSYKWSNGGKAVTFAIRQGVKWNDGSAMTPADVAFTYNMLMKYPDVNTYSLPITGATVSGNDVTIKFSSSQYTNLQNIANVYIVPQSVWGAISGDPATFTDPTPVGTGPYKLGTFSASAGITLQVNPNYWGGTPAVSGVDFPLYASNTTILTALENNSLDWAGNFLSGLQAAFVSPSPSTHKTWFAPVQTNSLEPNLTKWPTNQVAVRQAISLAIDRTAISQTGESGLEPVATNASGLVLPNFSNLLAPAVKSDTLSPHSNAKAADAVLAKAGYTIKNGYYQYKGKKVVIDITDPSAYTDYAEDDTLAAAELRNAHIDAQFVGQSATAWAADVASGNFELTGHWSQTSISAFQLYNEWLNSALATKNASGNFERLDNKAIDNDLAGLAGQTSVKGQLKYLTPIETYVANNLPVIPTVYGAAFDEYNTSQFTGWPSASNPYESGSPNTPTNEVVVLHLKPVS
jgi:peptide/nickel transport system substrate-binding protein